VILKIIMILLNIIFKLGTPECHVGSLRILDRVSGHEILRCYRNLVSSPSPKLDFLRTTSCWVAIDRESLENL